MMTWIFSKTRNSVGAWLPPEPESIWGWNEILDLAQTYALGMDDSFPIFQIATDA